MSASTIRNDDHWLEMMKGYVADAAEGSLTMSLSGQKPRKTAVADDHCNRAENILHRSLMIITWCHHGSSQVTAGYKFHTDVSVVYVPWTCPLHDWKDQTHIHYLKSPSIHLAHCESGSLMFRSVVRE